MKIYYKITTEKTDSPATGKQVTIKFWDAFSSNKFTKESYLGTLCESWSRDWSIFRSRNQGFIYPRCIKCNGNWIGDTITEAKFNFRNRQQLKIAKEETK